MNAGALRNRITVQHRTITTDEIGQRTETWTEYATVYAYANGLSTKDRYDVSAEIAENTVEFTVRHTQLMSVVNSKDYRIIFNDVVHEITSSDDIMYHHEWIKIRTLKKVIG